VQLFHPFRELLVPIYRGDKLTNNEKDMIDKDISLDELSTAVEILKPNKYLGEDGIISEFYQTLMAIYQQRISHHHFIENQIVLAINC
jgi:hypothetical protein